MRLALDNHYSPLIATGLRERGHDAVGAVERGWEREEDEALLATCSHERRSLLTNDVADFTAIARAWAATGRSHFGLIFTSDTSRPRNRDTIGRFIQVLGDLLDDHPGDEVFRDRVYWL